MGLRPLHPALRHRGRRDPCHPRSSMAAGKAVWWWQPQLRGLHMTDQWYYGHEGQRFGPVSIGELQRLAAVGNPRSDDTVWQPGEPTLTASEAPGLFPAPPSSPDEPPPFPPGFRGNKALAPGCSRASRDGRNRAVGQLPASDLMTNRLRSRMALDEEQQRHLPLPHQVSLQAAVADIQRLTLRGQPIKPYLDGVAQDIQVWQTTAEAGNPDCAVSVGTLLRVGQRCPARLDRNGEVVAQGCRAGSCCGTARLGWLL